LAKTVNQPQYVLTKCCNNPHTSTQLAQEKCNELRQDSYLAAHQDQQVEVHFHKQGDKMNHEARINHRRWNKSIIINQINKKS